MYKLDLEKAEEQEVEYQHSLYHGESKGTPYKYLILLHWLC